MAQTEYPRCDTHPDRPAVHLLGTDAPRGDGTMEFRVTRRLCWECYTDWKKHNVAFEYIR
jgi:hypothetical protein